MALRQMEGQVWQEIWKQ